MSDFSISFLGGLSVGIAWMAIWFVGLRCFGIRLATRNREARIAAHEHLAHMGTLRFIIVYGVLGYGIAFGLAVAVGGWIVDHPHNLITAFVRLLCISVFSGVLYGLFSRNQFFAKPTSFPPESLRPK